MKILHSTIDLDDLFNDIYYMDLPGAPAAAAAQARPVDHHHNDSTSARATMSGQKRSAEKLSGSSSGKVEKPKSIKSSDYDHDLEHDPLDDMDPKEMTEQQKLERRERNREHAKRSRLRKKFLLESLQEQIHGLEEQLENLKSAIRAELPSKADVIITQVCGEKDKYTPLPMPSGFGPVKTLMEPDFRLSKYATLVLQVELCIGKLFVSN
jgi:hypothetical protein